MGVFERAPGYAQNDEPSARARLGGNKIAAPFVDTVNLPLTVEQSVCACRIGAEPLPELVA